MKADIRHIAYCDIHAEANVDFHDILEWQHSYEPHIIILNGDVTLGEHASHWNEKTIFKLGYDETAKELKREFEVTHKLLKRIRNASPNARIIWVPGNHEEWYFWIALYHPAAGVILGEMPKERQYRSDLALARDKFVSEIIVRHFKTDELEIEVLRYNDPLVLGPLTYLHGHQFKSLAGTAKAYPNRNIVVGHFHKKRLIPISDSGRKGNPIQHFAVPTLMKLSRGYEKLKASDHSNGFFYANISVTGKFEGLFKDVFGDAGKLFPWQR